MYEYEDDLKDEGRIDLGELLYRGGKIIDAIRRIGIVVLAAGIAFGLTVGAVQGFHH